LCAIWHNFEEVMKKKQLKKKLLWYKKFFTKGMS